MSCSEPLEGRVVLRDGEVHLLMFCLTCGSTEQMMDHDAEAYLQSFIGRADVPDEVESLFKTTTSTCATCLALVDTDVVVRGGRVYFQKDCARCGLFEVLASEDARYYAHAYAMVRAGTEPLRFRTEVVQGCPTDCGTCPDHEQHTCLPIVEVTHRCDPDCPFCSVDNRERPDMRTDDFRRVLERLLESEGTCEALAIAGGEPTWHPQLLELIDLARGSSVGRVVVFTGGLRIGAERGFAEQLKQRGVWVVLQLEGFTAAATQAMRGRDRVQANQAALTTLRALRIPTELVFSAARGVNDDQLGDAVDLLLRDDHIASLTFQPIGYTGHGGGAIPHDPLDRLTIPGVIQRLEEQTDGRLRTSDFCPVASVHPQCMAVSHLLLLDNHHYVPLGRLVDIRRYDVLLHSLGMWPATAEVHLALEGLIQEVAARRHTIERGSDVLAALRRMVGQLFSPDGSAQGKGAEGNGRPIKSIVLHQYMDRYDFDLERLRKCSHHVPQIDGRAVPFCGYHLFHRAPSGGTGIALRVVK